ncbi:MAG: sodium:proton exchanger, partial [Phycisphaerae bacterium]|nr:sodium:proton exchanger [Phycisphaerae bacterium]
MTDLVVLLSVASLLGVVAERLRLSSIVGAIVGGMLVGPGLLGWVHNDHLEVQYVAEFGVALLLFTIGLEITREKLVAFGLQGAAVGVLQVVVTLVGGALAAWLFGWGIGGSIAIGSMVALSSTAAVARTLFDSGQLESQHGRMAVAMLLVQDLAIVPLVIGLTILGGPIEIQEVAAEIGFAGARMVGAVLIIGLVAVLLIPRLLHSSHLSGNRELPIVLAVVTAVLAAWLSHELGLSAAVGAFIAGLALANSPFARQIRSDVTGLKAIFLTIFFASIGTLADLSWIFTDNHIVTVIMLACVIVIGKAILSGFAARLAGVATGTALAAGICVAQIGEFS